MHPHYTFNFQDALLHAWNIQEFYEHSKSLMRGNQGEEAGKTVIKSFINLKLCTLWTKKKIIEMALQDSLPPKTVGCNLKS